MYMLDYAILEKKVKDGLQCHIELNCEECPYREYDTYATHENDCDAQLHFDAIQLFEYYGDAFAHLDTMYHNCREERDELQEERNALQYELNGLTLALKVVKLFLEEDEENE